MRTLLIVLIVVAVAGPQVVRCAEPVPIGHWKLDDKTGDRVLDSSAAKNHGKAVASPAQTTGKIGGALTFNGKDSYVEIPNSKELETIQAGSYTVSAWFKPEIVPPGTEPTANDAEFGIVMKTGWHEGLSYNHHKQFTMTHWLSGDEWNATGTWDDVYEPGQWYHVVGVVDEKDRVAKIFVNGELKGSGEPWAAGAKARDYGQQTWKIGAAGPGNKEYAWFANGAIDDVHLYKEALTEDQVEQLYKAGTSKSE